MKQRTLRQYQLSKHRVDGILGGRRSSWRGIGIGASGGTPARRQATGEHALAEHGGAIRRTLKNRQLATSRK